MNTITLIPKSALILPATKKEPVINYTPAMVARLKAEAPLNYAKAETLGLELGKNPRSIIAKAKREGIAYEAKIIPVPKSKGPTKAQMVKLIERAMDTKLIGLDKAPVKALENLIKSIALLAPDGANVVTAESLES